MKNQPTSVEIRDAIQRLSAAAASAALPEERMAAAASGGVPVHVDVGGVLVVCVNGVQAFDPATGSLRHVTDEWATTALVKAARRFPELASLLPQKPLSASSCSACQGTGSILGVLTCASCSGIGWIAGSSANSST